MCEVFVKLIKRSILLERKSNINIKDLESKYINKNLTIEEAKLFLIYLEKNLHLEFAERRIKNLKRIIASSEGLINANKERDGHNLEIAKLYVDLTKKWESHGAYFVQRHAMTKWYLDSECFYTWFSGGHVLDEFPKAKKADEKFESLLRRRVVLSK
ncbi:hypothetical protein Bateq7PJ16_2232 [Bacillus subtilis]|nr:hypothetical protein Bateq7PJ16_2232 [Bacillus subtilis]QMV48887.1 hypothetical protein Goe11_c01340 [Bacillus phage vB_BsuS-Goe11]UIS26577.1 hypothetical protein Goe14_01330 [Bacillus phage vB_BsuS-Goe14]